MWSEPRDHIGWNTLKIISSPNSDKIVMWRLLRNRRLILRLHTIFRALIYWAHRVVIFVCMFRIKFPTKCIFRIFPILRTDGMAPFGTYLWNDPRINKMLVV